VTRRLERDLLATGCTVVRMPTQLMIGARRVGLASASVPVWDMPEGFVLNDRDQVLDLTGMHQDSLSTSNPA
jgi:hypothetical protein